MTVEVQVTVAGDTGYHRAFQAFDERLGSMLAPLTAIRDMLVVNTAMQFATEGAHSGDPWQHLSAAYARWKQQFYPGSTILVRTGALRDLLRNKDQSTLEIGAHRLVWGVPDHVLNPEGDDIGVYAAAHQAGSSRLPRRRMIQMTGGELRGIDRIMVRWIAEIRRTVGV